MDKEYIEEHNILRRYSKNELSEQEYEEFEVYMMEHPELIEHLELDAVLLKEAEQIEIESIDSKKLFKLAIKQLFIGLGSVSAVLLVAVFSISFFSGPTVFELYSVRGHEKNTPVFELSFVQRYLPMNSVVELKFNVRPSGVYEYGEVLRVQEGSESRIPIHPYKEFSVSPSGEVTVKVRAAVLKPGRYQVFLDETLEKLGGTETSEKQRWAYSFKVD